MRTVGVASLLLPCAPQFDTLRTAAAQAYEVLPAEFFVGDFWSDDDLYVPGMRVYLRLWSERGDGDLPVVFEQDVDESLAGRVDTAVQRMAKILGMVIVTDDSDDMNPIIHMPDGTSQQRTLDSFDLEGYILPPDVKKITHSERPTRAA